MASNLRAFDRLNKPTERSPLDKPVLFACSFGLVCTCWSVILEARAKNKAQDANRARASEPTQRSHGSGDIPLEDPKKDAASNDETQEETSASQPAAENDNKAPGKDKD